MLKVMSKLPSALLLVASMFLLSCSIEDGFTLVGEYHFQVNGVNKNRTYRTLTRAAEKHDFLETLSPARSPGAFFGIYLVENRDSNPELRQLWRKDGGSFISYYYTDTENCFTFSISVMDKKMIPQGKMELDSVAGIVKSQLSEHVTYFGSEICQS